VRLQRQSRQVCHSSPYMDSRQRCGGIEEEGMRTGEFPASTKARSRVNSDQTFFDEGVNLQGS